MGKAHECITPQLAEFIDAQPMFFVASAPLSADGHVNLSPKGLDAFRVLSPHRVACLDLTGSGNETAAHLQENGRITFMFCAFTGSPRILRLYGRGRVALPDSTEWDELAGLFGEHPQGARQIIAADIHRVQTSCGFAVPLMEFVAQRGTLNRWAEKQSPQVLAEYWRKNNTVSIDGLPSPLAAPAHKA